MRRKKSGVLGAITSLAIVTCISLVIVGGVVSWMAANEGTSLSELVTELFREQRSTLRPLAAPSAQLPTATRRPLRTPIPAVAATPTATLGDATLSPQPTEPPAISEPALGSPDLVAAPVITAGLQAEPVLDSPIRPGSPLPERPATRLVIPAMQLDVPVIISPIISQTWKVDHLGKEYVGHLEGTASPGDPSNVVLAGHVTIAHNVYGPFAGLGQLQPGDPVIVYAGDKFYTYVVDYRQLVDRTDVEVAYPTTTGRITLITCTNWSDELGVYEQRLIVVGHLAQGG